MTMLTPPLDTNSAAAVAPPSAASAPTPAQISKKVNYALAAKRHLSDAKVLDVAGKHANAGQLFGFVAECGIKALLVACGISTDADGSIPDGKKFRQHMPTLSVRTSTLSAQIPDGRAFQKHVAVLKNLKNFDDWSIEHRYWSESELPAASFGKWSVAAQEVAVMLDLAKQDGILK